MNYVKSLNLFGIEARQRPCLTGSGVPTTNTIGTVGELYMDKDTGTMYKCVSDENGVYEWFPFSSTSLVKRVKINLIAANWVKESDNRYSQKISIADITPYSKVDLQPTVEQLAVFYEKDIAFVTENNGGDVTVYCIGQKPLNDYTMQATITEVTKNE